MFRKITAAIAGNPNSGKTSVFNMLTGTRQHVANYPGVTVEKKEGLCSFKNFEITFVDLPGTYCLTAYSEEELVARNYIIEEKPDVVVDVVDASNIERNLYLATLLIEMNVPLILAFNMSDIAARKGLIFDIDRLSNLLGAPIVQTVGNKGRGRQQLLDAVIETVQQKKFPQARSINYGPEIEQELARIEKLIINNEPLLSEKYGARSLAIKLLERDSDITSKITDGPVKEAVDSGIGRLMKIFHDEPQTVIADHRYGFISGACRETIQSTVELRHDISDIVDTVLTNSLFGLPIFLLLMFIVFVIVFKAGMYPMAWLETFFQWLSSSVASFWPAESHSLLKSLLIDGIISGVGGVIVFLPNILLLFLAIAFLEDTGYMARAAFVMDRLMHKIGLHGKSFIPMLIGFGCSVPAVMAARILENKRNRFTTIMVLPLFSCGAKLTIYTLVTAAFFPENLRGPVLWLMYIIGIVLAVILIKVLRLTIFRGETLPFVMELPPYRIPALKSICIHMWQRGWLFLKKAGTVILLFSILFWAAANFPRPKPHTLDGLSAVEIQKVTLENSVIGRLGRAIEPALKPVGFDWKIGTALIGATPAKELFVSQLAIVYAAGDPEISKLTLHEKLQENYSPLVGFCIMLFSLISTPCIATVMITRQETGSWLWPALQFFGLTFLAYILTLIVFQLGSLVI